ncbi:PI-PLC X domain-containing protein [Gossypium australe]|uniref:PI-PLC X domain-containing protein n=1 Tax=Gossypium australe TaxID=47621 RepID=A0A5B6WQU4_9ROSI|nr:PI-PLC X domain-containing protein [Gossypium australe]
MVDLQLSIEDLKRAIWQLHGWHLCIFFRYLKKILGFGFVVADTTLDSVIRACSRLADLREGRLVHKILIKYGFEFDQIIGGVLIEFCSDCEAIADAKRVYDGVTNMCLNASTHLLEALYQLVGLMMLN